MELSNMKAPKGAKHSKKRLGRGNATGQGKTAGRGHNGQNSRSGGGVRPGFEGGQNPLARRIPKRGFNNFNRKEYAIINLDLLERIGGTITPESLKEAGIIKDMKSGVKVLGNGTLTKKVNVQAHKCSASAKEAIEAAGGTIELV